jgi:release factor glutamine methyltransferase
VLHDYEVFPASSDTSLNRLIPLRRVIGDAASHLSAAGVASPLHDSRMLMAFVLDIPHARLPLVTGVTRAQEARFAQLVALRAARTPLQHLTGAAPFRHVEVRVGPGVFVPRPETELLAGWGLAAVAAVREPVVVDLCGGSGAIALAVADEHPDARVYAVERDPDALAWLWENTEGTPVTVVEGDATDPHTLSEVDGHADLVLCNPPYVPDGTPVPPEVAEHDPAGAVFAGPDGLAVIRGIVARAAALLRPGGAFAVEHDDSHGESVPALLRRGGGYERVEGHRDLAGRPRFATAYRRSP